MGDQAKTKGAIIQDMSYSTLDKIYSEMTQINFRGYKAFIGGVDSGWNLFNEKDETGKYVEPKKIADSEGFATFQLRTIPDDYVESSWKIHLSIHPADLGKAWDIVYPTLIANKIPSFKVSRMAVSEIKFKEMYDTDEQFLQKHQIDVKNKETSLTDIFRVSEGMQITIYIAAGKEHEYNELLKNIEPMLYKKGVRPGVIDKSDRSLGLYSSVRHVGIKYTAHDQVAGYKAVEEIDPFKPIKTIWDDVSIQWQGLKFKVHTERAKDILLQVVEAEQKYKRKLCSKEQFMQICDVATEYFSRWHKLLKKIPKGSLDNLPEYQKKNFDKLIKWIGNGYGYIPLIRKSNNKIIKAAEGALRTTIRINPLQIKAEPKLKRKNAQFDLIEHSDDEEVDAPEQKIDLTTVRRELFHYKKKSSTKSMTNLKRFAKSKSLSAGEELAKDSGKSLSSSSSKNEALNEKRDASVELTTEFKKETTVKPAVKPKAETAVKPKVETVKPKSGSFSWTLGGGSIGLGLGIIAGLLMSTFFPLWAVGLSIALFSLTGMLLGAIIEHYKNNSTSSQEKNTDVQLSVKANVVSKLVKETECKFEPSKQKQLPHSFSIESGKGVFGHSIFSKNDEKKPLLNEDTPKVSIFSP